MEPLSLPRIIDELGLREAFEALYANTPEDYAHMYADKTDLVAGVLSDLQVKVQGLRTQGGLSTWRTIEAPQNRVLQSMGLIPQGPPPLPIDF
jgi:hypothetical protein